MDKHHGLFHRTSLFSIVDEGLIIIKAKSHPANNDDIRIRLVSDPHQKRIVRLSGDRKDRDFLRFDKTVKDIDHRDICPNHLARNDTADGLKEGVPISNRLSNNFRPSSIGIACAIQATAQKSIAKSRLNLRA